eukprot:1373156-Amorphochlora_amoeboformis.AAC.1
MEMTLMANPTSLAIPTRYPPRWPRHVPFIVTRPLVTSWTRAFHCDTSTGHMLDMVLGHPWDIYSGSNNQRHQWIPGGSLLTSHTFFDPE